MPQYLMHGCEAISNISLLIIFNAWLRSDLFYIVVAKKKLNIKAMETVHLYIEYNCVHVFIALIYY